MSTVRAQNLQDLIYKRGQAGVTKASVTIVFDNNDKSTSPIGFEEYSQISVTRQIVMGGTSKYLINGHRAQQTTVQNLFQSVGLNINNPNFIIMQGRITKVLNMKAAEILAMIEEAAGTRMFEDRKEKATKTMAKKEMKVLEIEGLLKEEIEPKLDKLRGEKRAWLDYQKTQSELERLTRVVTAADYVRAGEKMKSASQEHELKKAKVQYIDDNVVKMKGAVGGRSVRYKRPSISRQLTAQAQRATLSQRPKPTWALCIIHTGSVNQGMGIKAASTICMRGRKGCSRPQTDDRVSRTHPQSSSTSSSLIQNIVYIW